MASAPSQATLTIKSGPGAGRVIDLAEGELVIRRSDPAGLMIGDSEVSRCHARLNCGRIDTSNGSTIQPIA